MRVEGAIYPTRLSVDFNREHWCRFVTSRPEFQRPPSKKDPNPFKPGELFEFKSTPDVADVMIAGRNMGSVYWSLSEDEPLVKVTVEPVAMTLVLEWAAELGGEFRPD